MAQAEDSPRQISDGPVLDPPPRKCVEQSAKEHMVGAALDVRKGSASAGLRYLHAHRQSLCGVMLWLQYGADVRNSNLDALVVYGVARAGIFAGGAPFGLELAVGPATSIERTIASMLLGAYVSAYYVDLGVSYQLPLGTDRPSWLGGGAQFSMRINIPVKTYAERKVERVEPDE